MPGSLTPPEKLHGEPMLPMTSTNPLDLGTIQTPPSPIPTPSPPLARSHTDVNGYQQRRYLYCSVYSNGERSGSVCRLLDLGLKALRSWLRVWQQIQVRSRPGPILSLRLIMK